MRKKDIFRNFGVRMKQKVVPSMFAFDVAPHVRDYGAMFGACTNCKRGIPTLGYTLVCFFRSTSGVP